MPSGPARLAMEIANPVQGDVIHLPATVKPLVGERIRIFSYGRTFLQIRTVAAVEELPNRSFTPRVRMFEVTLKPGGAASWIGSNHHPS